PTPASWGHDTSYNARPGSGGSAPRRTRPGRRRDPPRGPASSRTDPIRPRAAGPSSSVRSPSSPTRIPASHAETQRTTSRRKGQGPLRPSRLLARCQSPLRPAILSEWSSRLTLEIHSGSVKLGENRLASGQKGSDISSPHRPQLRLETIANAPKISFYKHIIARVGHD